MRVAIDVGYGYTKVVAEAGRKVLLPSTVGPARLSRGLASAFGEKIHDGHDLTVTINGEEQGFVVGSVKGQRSWASDASKRTGYVPLMLAAAYLAGAEGETEIEVGLPLALWLQKDQRKALRSEVRGLTTIVSLDGKRPHEIVVTDAHVLPQGAGAFALAVSTDPSLATKPTGLIDIGYKTTDYLLMRRVDGSVAPDESGCGSLDLGAGRIVENVRQILSDQSGVLVPEGAVEDALQNYKGKMFLRGKEYDVAVLVDQEAKTLAVAIEEQMRRVWTDRLDLLGAVLVTGGGGKDTYPHLRKIHPLTRLLHETLYSNAAGYLVMASS